MPAGRLRPRSHDAFSRYRAAMSGAPDHVVVQVTTASPQEASRIAHGAVERRLAASAQVGPLHTWYRWKGRVCEADEHLVSLFTRRERFDALARFVNEHHGYELPQVVAIPLTEGTPAFLRWIDEGCTPVTSDAPEGED